MISCLLLLQSEGWERTVCPGQEKIYGEKGLVPQTKYGMCQRKICSGRSQHQWEKGFKKKNVRTILRKYVKELN